MRSARRPLIAGNWKMHGLKASVAELEKIVRDSVELRQRLDLRQLRHRAQCAAIRSNVRRIRSDVGASTQESRNGGMGPTRTSDPLPSSGTPVLLRSSTI